MGKWFDFLGIGSTLGSNARFCFWGLFGWVAGEELGGWSVGMLVHVLPVPVDHERTGLERED